MMFEIAVRVKELASSNLNNLVDHAASPAKMLKLLQLELEEAIITLTGDATRAERRERDALVQAAAQDKAAADWQDKAKLALANDRDDLARAALAEKDNARSAAAALREAGETALGEAAMLHAAIADLEAKLDETRARIAVQTAKPDSAAAPAGQPSRTTARVEAMTDRLSTLEKRIDFAAANAGDSAKAASLDAELAALKREAALDDELAALKKSLKKK